jgi:hypothetical protein
MNKLDLNSLLIQHTTCFTACNKAARYFTDDDDDAHSWHIAELSLGIALFTSTVTS